MFAAEWYETLLTTAGSVATEYMKVQEAKAAAEAQLTAAKQAAKAAAIPTIPKGGGGGIGIGAGGLGGIDLTTVMLLAGGALLVMLLLKRK
jgi:hypothetical protein